MGKGRAGGEEKWNQAVGGEGKVREESGRSYQKRFSGK